jgi:hypothetical protein
MSAAGDEELSSSRNSEKDSERNAGEQNRKLLRGTASEQEGADQFASLHDILSAKLTLEASSIADS